MRQPIVENIDNTDGLHRFRLAVRADRHVQIYRDDAIVGVRRFKYRTPREASMTLGAGGGVEAVVGIVSDNLNATSQPEP